MLGSGVPEFEQRMRQEEQERPDHFRGWVGFSVPVSHRIMAGCDILLMPSRFEPCGLNQLFGMRYGTIPIAHATGGLRDTIEDYNPFANGELAPCNLGSQTTHVHCCPILHHNFYLLGTEAHACWVVPIPSRLCNHPLLL